MVWNHRVVHRIYPEAAPSDNEFWQIHEVYYSEVGAAPNMFTEEPVAPRGSTREELREVLEMMLKALDKPDVEYDEVASPR